MKDGEPPESEGETNRKKRKENEAVGEGGNVERPVALELEAVATVTSVSLE